MIWQKIQNFGLEIIKEILKNRELEQNSAKSSTMLKNGNEDLSQEDSLNETLNSALNIICKNIESEKSLGKYNREKNLSLMVIDALEFYLEEENTNKVTTKSLYLKKTSRLTKSNIKNNYARDALRTFSSKLINFIFDDKELSSALELDEYLQSCKMLNENNIVPLKEPSSLSEEDSEKKLMDEIQLSSRIFIEHNRRISLQNDFLKKESENLSMEEFDKELKKIFSHYNENESYEEPITTQDPIKAKFVSQQDSNSATSKLIEIAKNIIDNSVSIPRTNPKASSFKKVNPIKQVLTK